MNEVQKTSEVVTELWDILENRDLEIHIDVNPKETEGSHVAFNQAVGYIMGMHGIKPIFKPESFAASKVADHLVRKYSNVQWKIYLKAIKFKIVLSIIWIYLLRWVGKLTHKPQ